MTVNSAPEGAGDAGPDLVRLARKYDDEKNRRIRDDGNAQYVELGLSPSPSSRLGKLAEDPWVDHEALNAQPPSLEDGDDVRFLILGAGYGALLFAVRLLEAGFKPDEVRIIDTAGGFGGTWYWNRYPGLMCDVESSIYMPLLEETGHVPEHRFSYGPELRRHAENIAKKWHLSDKVAFRTQLRSCEWDDAVRRWRVALTQGRGPGPGERAVDMAVGAQFVILANGVLNHPKAPKIPGFEDFKGPMMHTGRWDYGVTGGSPEDPALSGLKGKKVGIVGTGATAVQCIPHLAKWADQLFVFQRTPSAVDERGQKETDPEEWKRMTASKGWWRARNENWNGIISGYPVENMVNDAWTDIATYRHLVGGPHEVPIGMQDIPELIARTLATDAPRMERLRKRVDDVVQDKGTAEALKAWYPSWCKRPCFHDEYLQTFNLPHVTLVDTDAKGIDKVTPAGIVAGGKEYDLDVIVWSTGYRAPTDSMSEPGKMCNATITGRHGLSLSDKWLADGPATLHGIWTSSFPNLLLTGPAQTGVSPNWVFSQDNLARHAAYVVAEAVRRAERPEAVTVEATPESEAAWSMQILTRSAWQSPVGVCGPNYMNNEGAMARQSQADLIKATRAANYPLGPIAFDEVLRQWRREGSMQGIVVDSGPSM